jgi:phosphoheptose isomerase
LRVIGGEGIFRTGEIRVNTFTDGNQIDPRIAVLADGSLVVVWTSWGQDGHMNGVFGRRLAANGMPQGGEFQVSVATRFNQRSASVTGLPGGDFIVVWVSEEQRRESSVDIFARRFDAAGAPLSGDVFVSVSTNICANPVICAAPQGDFVIAWSSRSLGSPSEDWDVIAAAYQPDGTPKGLPKRVNEYVIGPQFAPQLAVVGNTVLMAWTSRYQDGSREGVFGRFMNTQGQLLGHEFQINTLSRNRQIQPSVAGDGEGRFLAVWSSFVGLPASFEVLAQRYAATSTLPTPHAPWISALDSYSLMVSWPPLAGYGEGVQYQVLVDGEATPRVTSEPYLILSDLVPGSTHTARLAYVLADWQISEPSAAASGRTWGRDLNFDGLPDDWQQQYWQGTTKWPAPTEDSDGDGARDVDEFLAGTNPVSAASVLRVRLTPTDQGLLVSWTGVTGSVYQLQTSSDLGQWENVQGPRLAVEETVSVVIPPAGAAAYYRVIRIR